MKEEDKMPYPGQRVIPYAAMEKKRDWGNVFIAALFAIIIFLLVCFFCLIPIKVDGQTTTEQQYDNLLRAYEQLQRDCDKGVPASYNYTGNVNRPVSQGVISPCNPKRFLTNFQSQWQSVGQTVTVSVTKHFLKIAAVREDNFLGGMPLNSFRAVKVGDYTASTGYEGVFLAYDSLEEAQSAQKALAALDYCQTEIFSVTQTKEVFLYFTDITGIYQ